jgi:lipoyl(octanoyl) transferase
MSDAAALRSYEFRDLGRLGWQRAFEIQQQFVARRKNGEIPDQFLVVEHPHVITVGRNGKDDNLLAGPEVLSRTGIELYHTDRGGDVTYHGPGQIVGYPILDLRDWKRDVGAYVRAIEQMIIDALSDFGIASHREPGMTGVWTDTPASGVAKIAAIGVHISRWITSHGFALNVSTDLEYFSYIVPCGLSKPVTSMRQLGVEAPRQAVVERLRAHFEDVFGFENSGRVMPDLQMIGRV